MASMHTASQEAATLEALAATRCTAVVRTGCGETAKGAAEAVIRGGFKSVEFTLSIPNALELIADFSKRPGLLIGAGTVLTVEQAEAVVRAGAHYVVLPCMELSVVKWCAARHVVCMCGVSSPSEMWAAHKAGAHVAKVFPGAAGGPAFHFRQRDSLMHVSLWTKRTTEGDCDISCSLLATRTSRPQFMPSDSPCAPVAPGKVSAKWLPLTCTQPGP